MLLCFQLVKTAKSYWVTRVSFSCNGPSRASADVLSDDRIRVSLWKFRLVAEMCFVLVSHHHHIRWEASMPIECIPKLCMFLDSCSAICSYVMRWRRSSSLQQSRGWCEQMDLSGLSPHARWASGVMHYLKVTSSMLSRVLVTSGGVWIGSQVSWTLITC
jgi:hypothetical protein